jgi:nitrite reductase/ring-hydroxylating ferredoxin subunit
MAARERLICASGALVDGGSGIRFEVAVDGTEVEAFVVRFGGKVHAYLNRCSHVPVELDWQPGRFFDTSGLYLVCATHGALYAPESGRCLGGRCDGKGLVGVPLSEHDGGVYLIESE